MKLGPALHPIYLAYAEATGRKDPRRFRHWLMHRVGQGVTAQDTLLALAQEQDALNRRGENQR